MTATKTKAKTEVEALAPVASIKGFDANLQCRGFQFEMTAARPPHRAKPVERAALPVTRCSWFIATIIGKLRRLGQASSGKTASRLILGTR